MSPAFLTITKTFDDHEGYHDEKTNSNDKSKWQEIGNKVLRKVWGHDYIISFFVTEFILESKTIFIGDQNCRNPLECTHGRKVSEGIVLSTDRLYVVDNHAVKTCINSILHL